MASLALPAALPVDLLAVWGLFVLGVVVGQLLPRVFGRWKIESRVFPLSSVLARWGQLLLAYHAVVILRECWHHVCRPGTVRGVVRATIQWACGRGWSFQWPASVETEGSLLGPASSIASSLDGTCREASEEWYVTEKDLAFFEYHTMDNAAPSPNYSPWELMFDKDVPGFVRYRAWRRTIPSGKTEYKSVTIAPDVTPQEFMDMYLDDAFRSNWDGMVVHHEVLEHGKFEERQQVVRWIRRFPFAFLSDREYCIARRLFRGDDGSLTACTKAVVHPREYHTSSLVRMDTFWSMWRSRVAPCPWGSGKPATETVLLHHEDFKIPERLARFAVTHGMWGFVRKLSSTVPQYAEARRRRCPAAGDDPAAYGAGYAPNPPGASAAAHAAAGALAKAAAAGAGGGGQPRDAYRPRGGKMPKAGTVLLVGGLAVAIHVARGAAGGRGAAGRGRGGVGKLEGAAAPEGDDAAAPAGEAGEAAVVPSAAASAASAARQRLLHRRERVAPMLNM